MVISGPSCAVTTVSSVREFVECSFKELDIHIDWQGEREKEVGINQSSGKTVVRINSKYYRPTEVEQLLGDATKAKKKLGWEAKMPFEELVKIMVHADWEKVKNADIKRC